MNDEDISKLASKLTKTLATKEDLKGLATKEDLKKVEKRLDGKIDSVAKNLGDKIEEVNQNTKILLQYANGIDDVSQDHEKRLKRIEAVPTVAHELKLKLNR